MAFRSVEFRDDCAVRPSYDARRPIARAVEGFDTQADGGCHVARLHEIGRLALTKTENKGRVNRRAYFVLE
jgi:Ser-tRNA(Ala) deacylase AlaX